LSEKNKNKLSEPVGIGVTVSKIEAGTQTDVSIQVSSDEINSAFENFVKVYDMILPKKE